MSRTQRIFGRILVSLAAGLLVGFALSEISFLFLRQENRPAGEVELVIPMGTAEKVEAGESPPAIPEGMSFVRGDVLVVENRDVVDHQLGPLWIPAGQTASLNLDEENNFIYSCSFSESSVFGIDVSEPVTIWTRVTGILFSGLPMGAVIWIYSLVIWPMDGKKEEKNDPPTVQP
jgi:hypothetical protein